MTPQLRSYSLVAFAIAVATAATALAETAERPPRPNIVLINCDNLGYSDVEPFGSKLHRTPHLTKLAAGGLKLTHYYSASGVCTPSRAALMTGCYPQRVRMDVTDGVVLRPVSRLGLHPEETTIAEVLRAAGYATSIFGKWHLGDQPPFLPTRQGFDYYLGIPYSDDMTPRPGKNWPPLPLMENERVIEAPVDRDQLTHKLTLAAVKWIESQKDRPFFLYFPQCMPGSTRAPFASASFRGKSHNGPWGDSVEELDWSVGQIMSALARLGLTDKTIVIWTSDNGAPRRNPPQGRNEPLAGWGYSPQEGGMRVPCIVRWPGKVPAGKECDRLTTMMDWLPTLAHWAGADLPPNKIDGHDIRILLTGDPQAESPYEAFFYYRSGQLHAVRSSRWKLYVAGKTTAGADAKGHLYDVVEDPGEQKDISLSNADLVAKLKAYADQARETLGDGETVGTGQRRVGQVENPTPRVPTPR